MRFLILLTLTLATLAAQSITIPANVIIQGSMAGTNGIQDTSTVARGTCNAAARGTFYVEKGTGALGADQNIVCNQTNSTGPTFAWVPTGVASTGASIGGSVTGATNQSVLFASPAQVLAQDNAYFYYTPGNHGLNANTFSSLSGYYIAGAATRAVSSFGTGLTFQAQSAAAGALNAPGGSVSFTAGIGTGNAGSSVLFQVSSYGASGTADNGTVTIVQADANSYRFTQQGYPVTFYGAATGSILLAAADNGVNSNYFKLPGSYGTPGKFLMTDGGGNTSWGTPTGSGTVTATLGALTNNQLLFGNGTTDLKVGNLTGDISTTNSGVTTLATVNGAPGSCGDATNVCVITTNGKGQVTGQTTAAITGGGGGTGANSLGTYIVQTATNKPANAQVLSLLGTGVVKVTAGTGVLSIATASDFPTPTLTATATALATTPTRCAAGQYPLGVDVSGNAVNCSTAGGPGATYATQLIDFAPSIVGNTLNINPGRVAFGTNGLCLALSSVSTASISSPTSSGSGVLYISDSCALVLAIPSSLGGTPASSGITFAIVGTPFVPAGAFYVADVTITASTGITAFADKRSVIGRFSAQAGPGMTIDCTTGPCLLSTDAATIPMLGSTNVFTARNSFAAVQLVPQTVASLGSCDSSLEGTFKAVNNSIASPSYNAVAVGGGTTHIPVFCNGSQWVNH